jgi:hypothetical protein
MSEGTPTESMIVNGTNVETGQPSDPLASGIRPAVACCCDPTAEEAVVAYVNGQPEGLVYCDLIAHLMHRGFTLKRADRAIANSVRNDYLRVIAGGVYVLGTRFDPPARSVWDLVDDLAPYLLGVSVLAVVVFVFWLASGGPR